MGPVYLNADTERIYTNDRDFPLGAITFDANKNEFVFCKYNSGDATAVTAVAGYLAFGLDSSYSLWEVTCKVASASPNANPNRPVGFAQVANTNGTYGWFQYRGKNVKAILTDGGVANEEVLTAQGTTAGAITGVASPSLASYTPVGVALADDSGTALAVGSADIRINL